MKKVISLLLCVLLATSGLIISMTGAAANETIIDDFEQGGTNLSQGYWSANFTSYEPDATVAKNGSRSLKLVKNNTDPYPELHAAAATHNFDLSGKTHFETWVKTSGAGASGTFQFRIQMVDGNNKTWYNYNTALNIANTEQGFVLASAKLTDFTLLTDENVKYNPATESTVMKKFLFVLFGTPATTFNMWLDDIKLVNHVPDSGMIDDFEQGGTNLAQGYYDGGFFTSCALDSTVSKNGSSSLKLVKNNTDPFPELQAAASNHSFDLSGKTHFETWVKTSGAGTTGSFILRVIITDGNGKRWYNYLTSLNIAETEAGFVLMSAKLSDFSLFTDETVKYNPATESHVMKHFHFVWFGTPATTFTTWLDDIKLVGDDAPVSSEPTSSEPTSSEPASSEPVSSEPTSSEDPIPDPPTPDTTGVLKPIQNFDSVNDVAGSGFNLEVSTHGNLSLETDPQYVKDGTKSLKIAFNGSAGFTSINVICSLLGDINVSGYTHLEAWIKTSPTGSKGPFDVRTRLNIGGTWYAASVQVYRQHTDADFVQIRVPLTSLSNTIVNYNPEEDITTPFMYQFDFTTFMEPYDIWVDGISLVNVNSNGEPEPTKYDVTFNSMGGSPVEDQKVIEGQKVSKPANPTRNGYTFDCWKYADGEDDEGNTIYKVYDFNTPITADLELRAFWKSGDTKDTESTVSEDPADTSEKSLVLPIIAAVLTLSGSVFVYKRKKSVI